MRIIRIVLYVNNNMEEKKFQINGNYIILGQNYRCNDNILDHRC